MFDIRIGGQGSDQRFNGHSEILPVVYVILHVAEAK